MVPIISDNKCVNFFSSYLLTISHSKVENTNVEIENIFQKGNSAIFIYSCKALKHMREHAISKLKLFRFSGISFQLCFLQQLAKERLEIWRGCEKSYLPARWHWPRTLVLLSHALLHYKVCTGCRLGVQMHKTRCVGLLASIENKDKTAVCSSGKTVLYQTQGSYFRVFCTDLLF